GPGVVDRTAVALDTGAGGTRDRAGHVVGENAVRDGRRRGRGARVVVVVLDGAAGPEAAAPAERLVVGECAAVLGVGGPALRQKRVGRDLAGIPLLVSDFQAASITANSTSAG